MQKTSDINVIETRQLPTPAELLSEIPKTEAQGEFVTKARAEINEAIFHKRERLMLVLGPCSIHDPVAGLDYARKLAALSQKVSDRLLIVMRVYFEKPRTTVGWKGLIMDPHLDGTNDIPAGLREARKILRDVLDLGLPTATEFLDPITPQYIADLICWAAIGARTTESQTHRQLSSGLSMPIGFKNGTDGSLQTAVNAIKAASQAQTFMGINLNGVASAVKTRGNQSCHVVLRGGATGPNYSAEHVKQAGQLLEKAKLPRTVMVDCSHENSSKNPENQKLVMKSVIEQITGGDRDIFGVMIESNLHAGNQPFPQPKENLKYGVSITDGCIDWASTEELVMSAYAAMAR